MDEKELLEYLKNNNPDDFQTFMTPESKEQLERIWEKYSITLKKGDVDFDAMQDEIYKKIGVVKQPNHKKKFILTSINAFQRVAAVLFIPLLLTTIYFWLSPKSTEVSEDTMVEVTTLPGTVTKLILSDSSRIWLNQSTTFRYPRKFNGKERNVFLVDGEAYFEVKSDKDHPFVVDNSMMKTIVTGTKFNINASAKDGLFEASLIEGKVALESGEHRLNMKPGLVVNYNASNKSLASSEKSAISYISWINNELIFEDEHLEDVFVKLGRWYNVDFVLKDDVLKKTAFTARIKSENLNQLLDNMKKSLPIDYTIKEDKKLDKKIIIIH